MKSPLKSNIHFSSTKQIKKIIEPKSKISSFYLYDGVVESSLADFGCLILPHTNKKQIFEFWSFLIKNPAQLSTGVNSILPIIDQESFTVFQETWFMNPKEYSRAVLFYILCNCSDLGFASVGKMNKSNISPLSLSKLSSFSIDNFYPIFDDCENPLDALDTAKKTDYILLPIGNYSLNLFEQGKNKGPEMYTFNHKEIHAKVKDLDKKCILLYKNHPALFNLYKSFNIKMVDKYGRVADNKESCEDLIITNF